MTTEQAGYQGYTNYQTFAVALWLNNDYDMYHMLRSIANDKKGGEDYERANTLEEWAEQCIEEQIGTIPASFITDLLNAAMAEVNWLEIIQDAIDEDVEDEGEEEAQA